MLKEAEQTLQGYSTAVVPRQARRSELVHFSDFDTFPPRPDNISSSYGLGREIGAVHFPVQNFEALFDAIFPNWLGWLRFQSSCGAHLYGPWISFQSNSTEEIIREQCRARGDIACEPRISGGGSVCFAAFIHKIDDARVTAVEVRPVLLIARYEARFHSAHFSAEGLTQCFLNLLFRHTVECSLSLCTDG